MESSACTRHSALRLRFATLENRASWLVPTVSLVLRDQHIVDIARANRDLERNDLYPTVPPPEDMLDLIARYEYGMKFPHTSSISIHLSCTQRH